MNAIKLGFLGKVFAISCLSLLALCGVAVADGPAGEWVIVTNAGGQETEATLNITESDGTVSGTITSDLGNGPGDRTDEFFKTGKPFNHR